MVNTRTEKSMDMAFLPGKTGKSIRDNGITAIDMVKVFLCLLRQIYIGRRDCAKRNLVKRRSNKMGRSRRSRPTTKIRLQEDCIKTIESSVWVEQFQEMIDIIMLSYRDHLVVHLLTMRNS